MKENIVTIETNKLKMEKYYKISKDSHDIKLELNKKSEFNKKSISFIYENNGSGKTTLLNQIYYEYPENLGLVTSVCLIRKDTHFLCIDQNMKSSLILFAKLKKLQIK